MIIVLFKKFCYKLKYLYYKIKSKNYTKLHNLKIDEQNIYIIEEDDIIIISNRSEENENPSVDNIFDINIEDNYVNNDDLHYENNNVNNNDTYYENTNVNIDEQNLFVPDTYFIIENLLNEMVCNCNTNKLNILVNILLINDTKLNSDYNMLTNFWKNNTEQILNYCKQDPKLIMCFGLKDLDDEYKLHILSTFSIKIFNEYMDESILLCNHNLNLIVYNIMRKNIKLGKILENRNASEEYKKIVNKNAYSALGKHKYGIAYLLFKKNNDKKGMLQIYERYVPDYIKELVNFENDFK